MERSKRSHSEAEMDIDMDSDSKRVKEGSADELEDDDEVVEGRRQGHICHWQQSP